LELREGTGTGSTDVVDERRGRRRFSPAGELGAADEEGMLSDEEAEVDEEEVGGAEDNELREKK